MTTVSGKPHHFNVINLEISRVYTTKEIKYQNLSYCTNQVSRLPIGFKKMYYVVFVTKYFQKKQSSLFGLKPRWRRTTTLEPAFIVASGFVTDLSETEPSPPSTTVKTIDDKSLIVLWPSKIHWSGSSASKVGSIVSLFFSITGLTPRMKLRPEHPTTSTNSRSF